MDSQDPPESIGTKKSTNIPCIHMLRMSKKQTNKQTRKSLKIAQIVLFQIKSNFLGKCVKECLHTFLLQINQINKIKHNGSAQKRQKRQKRQKTRFMCNFNENQVFR